MNPAKVDDIVLVTYQYGSKHNLKTGQRYELVRNVSDRGCITRTPFGIAFRYWDEILAVNPEGAKLHPEILIAENRKIDGVSRA